MGVTIATVANGSVVLAPSDSAAETAEDLEYYTDTTQPQEVRDLWAGCLYRGDLDLPAGVNPQGYKLQGGALVKISTLASLDNLKAAARGLHNQLQTWSELLTIEGQFHPFSDVQKGHDFLYQAHRGAHLVITRHTGITAIASLTIAQRIGFCQLMSRGAADVISPATFFENLPSAAPTLPCVWVDPRNAPARVNLDDAISTSTALGIYDGSIDLSGIDFSGASWIDSLTE